MGKVGLGKVGAKILVFDLVENLIFLNFEQKYLLHKAEEYFCFSQFCIYILGYLACDDILKIGYEKNKFWQSKFCEFPGFNWGNVFCHVRGYCHCGGFGRLYLLYDEFDSWN